MSQNNLPEDDQFRDVINSLKRMKKVDAPPGFDADLMRRINSEVPAAKQGLWEKIVNSFLFVPATGAAVVATLIIMFLSLQPQKQTTLNTAQKTQTQEVNEPAVDSLAPPPVEAPAGNQMAANTPVPKTKINKSGSSESTAPAQTGGTYPSALQSKPKVDNASLGESTTLTSENSDKASVPALPLSKVKSDSTAAKKKAPLNSKSTDKKLDKKSQ